METMRWTDEGILELLDQTRLPSQVVYIKCANHREVAAAIKRLAVRGAPAIGAAAAFGLVLAGRSLKSLSGDEFIAGIRAAAAELAATRPTAVNLYCPGAVTRRLETAASRHRMSSTPSCWMKPWPCTPRTQPATGRWIGGRNWFRLVHEF